MTADKFWIDHVTPSEAARMLGESRQNVNGRCKSGKYPRDYDDDGSPGIPLEWVKDTLVMRGRDADS